MKSVMVFWVYSAEQYANNTPLYEVAEHAQLHGFNDEPVEVLCLQGYEFVPSADIAQMRQRNFILQDISPLFRRSATRYPNLRRRYPNHFFECFLRWIVLKEHYQGAPLLAWDADIFFNENLSRLHAEFAGSTFTSSSTCFAALHDPHWLEVYQQQLDRFEKAPELFLAGVFAQLNEIKRRGQHDFSASFFGAEIEASLDSVEAWTQLFDSTPEEMFVDYLVRSGLLPHYLAKGRSDYLLCPQPLLLPELAWVHPMGAGLDARSPGKGSCPLAKKDGRYHVGGRPLAFLHFQGALFRACAAHQILHDILHDPQPIHDEYCPPDRRAGQAAWSFLFGQREATSTRLAKTMSPEELHRCWGDPYSERDVARNHLIKSDILEVLRNYGWRSGDCAGPETAPSSGVANALHKESGRDAAGDVPADSTEAGSSDKMSNFVAQLAQFFISETLLQVDWTSDQKAHVTAYKPGGGVTSIPQVVETDAVNPRLPLADAASDTVFNLASLSRLSEANLVGWLKELYRVTSKNLWVALEAAPGRDRVWWESRFLEAGFRKHPLSQCIISFEAIESEGLAFTLLFQKVPQAALGRYPLAELKKERDLHMDMLRESGIRSDAHLARYNLAREYLKPGMIVLDAACGLGYGSAMMATRTDVARVIGMDLSEGAVEYARANYGAGLPQSEFRAGDATKLGFLADASVDAVVRFETLEHLPNPDRLLQEFSRVLKPGGLFIGSVPNLWIDEHGRNPVPYHLHIYDHAQFREQVAKYFEWQALYRQNAGGGWKRPQGRLLRLIEGQHPTNSDQQDAEWWISVARKPMEQSAAIHHAAERDRKNGNSDCASCVEVNSMTNEVLIPAMPAELTALLDRAVTSAADGHKVVAELLLDEALWKFPDSKDAKDLQCELQTTGAIKTRPVPEPPPPPPPRRLPVVSGSKEGSRLGEAR